MGTGGNIISSSASDTHLPRPPSSPNLGLGNLRQRAGSSLTSLMNAGEGSSASSDRDKLLGQEAPASSQPAPVNVHSREGDLSKEMSKKSLRGGQLPTPWYCRSTTLLFAALLLGGLAVLYIGNSSERQGLSLGLDKDRATTYNVKILPSSLSDKELDALPAESFSYLAMIDAGSSGCRAHIYRYGKLGSIEGALYVLPQHISKKVKPGLSSFAATPDKAGASLADLVAFVKEKVPEKDWAVTPIWLKATAGLRMLEESQSAAVLQSVRAFLGDKASSPFIFKQTWAGIISGNEEGGFGWIAFNYLKKIIGPKKKTGLEAQLPYAVIEMGGASAQVSQIAPTAKDAADLPEEYKFSFTIEGETFTLYTHSYLGYGAEQAREGLNKLLLRNVSIEGTPGQRTLQHDAPESSTLTHRQAQTANATKSKLPRVRDTCLYEGYSRADVQPKEAYEGPKGKYNVVGSAQHPGACSTSLAHLFTPHAKTKACTKARGPYSFNCVHQPAFIADSPNFLVFENFFYTASAAGVKSFKNEATSFPLLTTPAQFQTAANELCSQPWSEVQTKYPLDSQGKDVDTKLCFIASYASVFLTRGLAVRPDKVLTVQKDVDGSEIEWALGAAYKEAADFLKRTNLRGQN